MSKSKNKDDWEKKDVTKKKLSESDKVIVHNSAGLRGVRLKKGTFLLTSGRNILSKDLWKEVESSEDGKKFIETKVFVKGKTPAEEETERVGRDEAIRKAYKQLAEDQKLVIDKKVKEAVAIAIEEEAAKKVDKK